MSRISQRYLAEQLGVSKATVSMVFNNKPGISAETRDRILRKARTMGYKARRKLADNKAAYGNILFIIFKKHGKIIGNNTFFSSLIESIEHKADQEGYGLSIRYINSSSDLSEVPSGYYGGILLLGTEMDESDLNGFFSLENALVVLDNSFPYHPINTVSIDNVSGVAAATRHLIEKGHTKIGYMRSAVEIQNFADRYRGYAHVLKEAGFAHDNMITLDLTMEGSYLDMKRWLASNKLNATAFVADNDCIALGAIRALREKGINLGRDISVIGFDDLPFAQINETALTTVRVFNDMLGAAALSRLIHMIHNPDETFCHMTIGTSLIIRDSVASLR